MIGPRRPPALATRIVELFLAPGRSRDGLLGDMEERFHKRATAKPFRARIGYWAEAMGSITRYALESLTGGGFLFQGLRHDLRISIRSLRRRPAFTILILGMIALGVGASSAVFSVVNALLVEPLPFEAQDRLVMADQRDPSTGFRAAVSMPNYEDWRDRSAVFDRFAMEKPETFRVGGEQGMDVLEGRLVLGDFFEAFGVPPVAGRLPTNAELGPGAEPIVVLTEGLWESHFGGDQAAIGATLDIDSRPYRIAGVVPAEFTLDSDIALYLPMGLGADDLAWQDRNTSYGGWIVARLRAGVTMSDARADLTRVAMDMREAYGQETPDPALFSMREWYVGEVRTPALLLMGAVLFVLLIACANVASLLLGRAEERRNELAIRKAVGASRAHVIRQLMIESGVLGITGGVLGLLLAWLGLDALLGAVGSTLPPAFVEKVDLDPLVVWTTLGASLVVAFAFGLAPALYASGRSKPAGGRVAIGPTSARLRGMLVSGEIALSVVLLVCTGLLVRSVNNLERSDTGFNAEGILVQRVSVPRARYPTPESRALVQREIRERVARLPGVMNAASSNLYPLSRTNWEMMFRRPSTWPAERGESVLYTAASEDYLDVFSIELLSGRRFEAADGADAPPVVIIDETAAARYWPDENPIGQVISVDDVREGDEFVPRWRTIVGVTGHVRNYEIDRPSRIEAYVPLSQSAACCTTLWLTVRTTGAPSAMASSVRAVIKEVDSEIAAYRVNTMQSVIENETAIHRAVEKLFGVFGIIAVILGAIGIAGIVAASVVRRRRDIALRVALGSAPISEAANVAAGNLRWVVGGLSFGLMGALAAGNALRSMLVEVTPFDPVVLALSIALLGSVALLAAWIPALRAARLDPVSILNSEG